MRVILPATRLTGLVSCGQMCKPAIPRPCKAVSAEREEDTTEEVDRQNAKKRLRFHRLQQTPEERNARPEPLLDRAEASLIEYCSALPGDGEDAEHCWVAYDYFERRKEDAESGCEIDYDTGSRSGQDCAKLDSFESFVRNLLGHTPMSSFAHLLYTLRKGDLHDHADAEAGEGKKEPVIAEVQHKGGGSHFELQNVPDNPRDRLVALFQAMDRDGNGRLDTGEFRDAMDKLGMQHLTGTTVSTILTAMDIHGPITLEDFLHIVEAEEINSNTPVANWLRTKRGESKFWGDPIETM